MIDLSIESNTLLKKCLKEWRPELILMVEDVNTLKYTESFYNQLRDVVGCELIAKGFNENYEPNNYGIRLEKLIDEIGNLFM
ncbi:hypothetical protein [Breznakia pachnodae]|uniref:Uncharacterized protein n=1 Tax=Breznakia pachnodae TaxID=265178 RepID=A0ABU0E1C6_9FIRM|nr:hypothetical protein [Breznakia pachnodae]MDQ0360615.1 hypothetical protein [Breznakia pachnodae]